MSCIILLLLMLWRVQNGVGVDVDAELATILTSTCFKDSFTFDKATGNPVTKRVHKHTHHSPYLSNCFIFDKATGSSITKSVLSPRVYCHQEGTVTTLVRKRVHKHTHHSPYLSNCFIFNKATGSSITKRLLSPRGYCHHSCTQEGT